MQFIHLILTAANQLSLSYKMNPSEIQNHDKLEPRGRIVLQGPTLCPCTRAHEKLVTPLYKDHLRSAAWWM